MDAWHSCFAHHHPPAAQSSRATQKNREAVADVVDTSDWVHDADGDRLFVQVAAGVENGVLLVVETETNSSIFHVFRAHPKAGSACS